MIRLIRINIICFSLLFSLAMCTGSDRIQSNKKLPWIIVDGLYPNSCSIESMVTIIGKNIQTQRHNKLEVIPSKISDEEISFINPANLKVEEEDCETKLNRTNTTFKISDKIRVTQDTDIITDQEILNYNYTIGTQTFDPQYRFSQEDDLIETARAILEMGSNILKISLNAEKYGLSHDGSAVSLIQEHASFKEVLDMPFRYYFFWIGTHSNWRDGYTQQERLEDSTLISDLTIYLREKYNQSGKQFYLGHWEGDWYLLPDYNVDYKPTDISINGMIEYYNARQNALEDAKNETPNSDVEIYQYAEVNRVVDAMKGEKRLTNYVLPYSNVDYVSYSAYDGQMKSRSEFHAILNYIEKHLPVKEGIEGKRVYIGEYGIPAKELSYSKFKHESVNRNIMINAVSWGTPFVLYWELYNNEVNGNEQTGFWLMDDTGVKWPYYYTHYQTLGEGKKWVEKFKNNFHRMPTQEEYLNWLEEALSQ